MIEVKNLTKKYGPHKAIDNISFTVNDGEILGFLGPNAAGKTTTMNIMTGFISATEGSVKINGYDIVDDPIKAKKHLGYLPDVPPIYGDMTVKEYLNFVCDLKGVSRSVRKLMINEILDTVQIKDVYKRLIKNLSKGYKQRVGLAQALVGYPEVLILDEPTVGLDPKQIIQMRDLIKRLGKKHTVILSSHILSEVSAVCDRVMIVNKGKLVATEVIEDFAGLESNARQSVVIKGDPNRAILKLKDWSTIDDAVIYKDNGDGTYELRVYGKANHDIREIIFATMAEEVIPVIMLKPISLNLEDVFLKVINGEMEAGQSILNTNSDVNKISITNEEHNSFNDKISITNEEYQSSNKEGNN